MVVIVGDQHVEHQPRIQPHAGACPVAAVLHDLGQRLQRGGPVLERARLVQQLAGVDDVATLGVPGPVPITVEPFDDVDRLRRVVPEHRRRAQAERRRQVHHDVLVDDAGREVIEHVVRLEDVRGRLAADGLVERPIAIDHQQLVLGAGGGHAFRCRAAQRHARQVADSLAQLVVGQRLQPPRFFGVFAGGQQHQRAGRFGTQVFEQRERVVAADVGLPADDVAQPLFGQQVVEVPLNGPVAAAVLMLQGRTRQGGREVEAVRGLGPLRVVLEAPEVVAFTENADWEAIQVGNQFTHGSSGALGVSGFVAWGLGRWWPSLGRSNTAS